MLIQNALKEATLVDSEFKLLKAKYANVEEFRDYVYTTNTLNEANFLTRLAVIATACDLILGLPPRLEQIQAVLSLQNSSIIEQDTGEGKTLVVAMLSCLKSLDNKGSVHVVTSSEHLSARDFDLMNPLFEFLGIKAANINSSQGVNERFSICKENPIVYTTIPALVHDIMYFQYYFSKNDYVTRASLIVDEADLTLLDQAIAPFSLTSSDVYNVENFTENVIFLNKLISLDDVIVDLNSNTCILNATGLHKVEKIDTTIQKSILDNREVSLEIFLKSSFLMEYDFNYTIENDVVYLLQDINGSTVKTVMNDTGMSLALKIKHEIPIVNATSYGVKFTSNQMTFMEFTNYYDSLHGLTATALVHAKEFKEFYNVPVVQIPRSFPLDRHEEKAELFFNNNDRNTKLLELLNLESSSAVIIACSSFKQSLEIEDFLNSNNVQASIINSEFNDITADIIKKLGTKGNISIVNPKFSRGIDIVPSDETSYMTLIFVDKMPTKKIEYQMKGRIARQGAKGVVYSLISTTDSGVDFNVSLDKKVKVSKVLKMILKQIERKQDILMEAEFIARKGLVDRSALLENGRDLWLLNKEIIFNSQNFNELLTNLDTITGNTIASSYLKNLGINFSEAYLNDTVVPVSKYCATVTNKAWASFLQEAQNFDALKTLATIGGVDTSTYYDSFTVKSLTDFATLLRESLENLILNVKFS